MTIYNWYNLFNMNDFDNMGIPSFSDEFFLTDVGAETIMITKGNLTSILFRDTFLPVNLNGKNPFVVGTYAVYYDENFDIWLGIEKPEDE